MKLDLPHCLDLEENKELLKAKVKVNALAVAWMDYNQKENRD